MSIKKELQIITSGEVLKRLNVPRHRLKYLFDSRKLKREEFQKLPNGDLIFQEDDVQRIKELLFK